MKRTFGTVEWPPGTPTKAEPDFYITPPEVADAIQRAADDGWPTYGPDEGESDESRFKD